MASWDDSDDQRRIASPTGYPVNCPDCNEEAIAIVPGNSKIAERKEDADGKVRVDCRSCKRQFFVYFRLEG